MTDGAELSIKQLPSKSKIMFNLDKFIADSVTHRPSSMFEADILANAARLTQEIEGKSVCVIGGARSIGSSFIKAVLRFRPGKLVVIDLNENGLAGFINANLALRLLESLEPIKIVDLDNLNNYYDPSLKDYRLGMIADKEPINLVFPFIFGLY